MHCERHGPQKGTLAGPLFPEAFKIPADMLTCGIRNPPRAAVFKQARAAADDDVKAEPPRIVNYIFFMSLQ